MQHNVHFIVHAEALKSISNQAIPIVGGGKKQVAPMGLYKILLVSQDLLVSEFN